MSEFNYIDNNDNTDIKDNSTNKKQKKQNTVSSLLEYLEILVFAISFVVLLFTFCTRMCEVSGTSMNNTLQDGEKLLVSNVFYKPQSEDIIVFHQTGSFLNEPVVKRVIAVGGETVNIDFKTWTVSVTDKDGNTRILDEDYAFFDEQYRSRYEFNPSDQTYPIEIPEGYLFVMGDNRFNSLDSRFDEVGLVDERRVLGKVIFRITPFEKMGAIN